MSRGELCRISNCKNIIKYDGNICPTHRWRLKHYGSYDKLNHVGEPSVITNPLEEGMIKICKVHGQLNVDQVYARYYKGNPNYSCKECVISSNIRRQYKGLSGLDCYNKMLKSQNGQCAICKSTISDMSNNKKTLKKLGIDHCHKTGNVRGLLCGSCNSGIGYFRDSPELLQKAIDYLKFHT